MNKTFLVVISFVIFFFTILGLVEVKADTSSTGYTGPSSKDTSQSIVRPNSNLPVISPSSNNSDNSISNTHTSTSSDTNSTSTNPDKSLAKNTTTSTDTNPTPPSTSSDKSTTVNPAITPNGSASNNGTQGAAPNNVQSDSVSVEPFSGSANLTYPFQIPLGRGGIHPNIALSYSSANRTLGFAGVGWTLELGSIKISTKDGVPKYDGTDIYTLVENGNSKNLVYDSQTGFYREDVEGTFANIQQEGNGWVLTDKKGVNYYFGQTDDSRQYDSANSSHVFQWALNKVEDLNGNYMTISYLKNQGQIYPQTINYTGNDQGSFSLNPYAQVNINYGINSVSTNSEIQGFSVTTAQRINTISISVNGNQQALYTLSYTQSPDTGRDLLQSIQQTGSDGISTLPAVTFRYQNNNGVFAQSHVSSNSSQADKVLIGDFNSDGFMDIADYAPSLGTVKVSFGSSSGTFASQTTWLTGAPFNQTVIPISVKGNGKTDLVFYDTTSGNWTVAYSTGSSFSSPVLLQSNWGVGQPVGMADFNGDGLADLYTYKIVSGKIYARIMVQQPSGSFSDLFNQDILIGNAGDTILTGDFNGDGLTDFCALTPSTGQWTMTYNSGNYSRGFISGPVITGFGTNQNAIVGDFNGDGKIKIGYVDTSTAKINYRSVDSSTITTSTVALSNASNSFAYQGVDMNSDGVTDVFGYNTSGGWEELLNGNTPTDLLISVNNGIGASTNIVYDSAVHYPNTFLPFFIPVVKSITKTVNNPADPSMESYTTNYSYSAGQWDSLWREFDGFGTVIVIDAQGNYATTTYLQDHYTKGRISEQDSYDSKGNLYTKVVNQWQTQNIATDSSTSIISKFVYLARTDNYSYNGALTAKRNAQAFIYAESPQYGDLTKSINYGEVDSNGNEVGTNEQITNNEYVYNTDDWIILPKHTYLQDINNNTVSQTWNYYDDADDNNAISYLGQLTKKVTWLGSSTQSDPATTYSYDVYGNQLTTTDPNGNTTTTIYDNDVYMFPVQKINALGQTVSTTNYGVAGISLNNGTGLQGLWGQSRSMSDLNNQMTYTSYDAFGRPTTTVSPLDSITYPTTQKIYGVYSNYTQITTKSLINNGTAKTVDTAEYYDGLGRLIEKKSLGPSSGEYIVSELTAYDNRAKPVKKYLPFFTNNDLNTIDALDTAKNVFTNNSLASSSVVPFSQTAYDPLGRVITKTNPDSTYSSVSYNQWTTTNIDENGHRQDTIVDGFGRLVKKQIYTGADGRDANDYSQNAYTLYSTTTYGYNVMGKLTSVTDDKSNVTTIQYDNLGRKTRMNDPDMGQWQYGYDTNGNLISQIDAKGLTIRFSYDQLNRLLNKTDGNPAGPFNNFPNLTLVTPTFNEAYAYDFNPGHPQLALVPNKNKRPANQKIVLANSNFQKSKSSLKKDSLLDKLLGVQDAYAAGSCNGIAMIDSITAPSGYITTSSVTFTWDGGTCVTSSRFAIGTSYTIDMFGNLQIGGKIYDSSITGKSVTINNLDLNNQTYFVFLTSYFSGLNVRDLEIPTIYTFGTHQPTVALTTPANGACYVAPANIVLTATPINSGHISWVAFYNGSALLNQASNPSPPITDSLINVPTGTYNFSVKVKGNITMTTPPTTVNVIPAQAPTVSLSASVSGSNVNLSATATPAACQSISKVEFYNGSTKIGTATSSPYKYTWNNAPNGVYSLTAEVYSGSATATSTPVTVSISPSLSPVVILTAQGSNNDYTAPENFILTATASKSGTTISKIDFYNHATYLGSSTSSPYTFSWSNVAAGSYILTANATFSDGTSSVSPNVYITLRKPDASPLVSLTAPAYNSLFSPGANITLTANASKEGGSISRVAFYNGTSLLGTVTASPYTYTWNNVSAGNYSLTALATDSNGVTRTSAPVAIFVASNTISNQSYSIGHLSQESYDNGGEIQYLYDALGRKIQSNKTINGTTYSIQKTYNALNNITQIQYPNGDQVTYAYNQAGQVSGVQDAGAALPRTALESIPNNDRLAWFDNTLGVTNAYASNSSPPSITIQSVDVTVTAPAKAIFKVAASATPSPKYQWMKSVNGGAFTNITSATSATYTTAATSITDNGTQYECVVSNVAGSVTSNAATLTVNVKPSITTQPVNVTVTAPVTATFSVAATGMPAPTYRWQQKLPGDSVFTAIIGAINASYTTPATTTANSTAKYECVVTNAAGYVTSNVVNLTVNPTPAAPSITTQPLDVTVTTPAKASFTITASGTPVPTYQWMNSVNGGAFTRITGATGASYTTAATTAANNGIKYECVVTNSMGQVTSNAATLMVNIPSAPIIVTQPVNATAAVPATASFTVAANGAPTPTYQWKKMALGANTFTNISGATSATYTTPATTIANSGTKYECVLTNTKGSVTSNAATLTVVLNVAASITTQPVNAAVTAPASATFTVVATGTPAPTYQWESEAPGATSFSPINGATNASYTTAATTTANSITQYECVVTNSVNSVTSNAVTLTVNEPAPVVSLEANSDTYEAPGNVTLTANPAQLYGTIRRVDFYNGSSLLESVTSSPYTYKWKGVAAGSYSLTARAYNDGGQMAVSDTVNITVVAPNNYIQSINYNAQGQITQIQYGNGVVTAYSYNPLNSRLTRIYTSNSQALTIQDLNYTYDAAGQVLTITDKANKDLRSMSQNFSYDALNRLVSATGSYGSKTYVYDSIGNIINKDGLKYNYGESNSRTDGSAAGAHAVTSLSDGTTFIYDLNGNMVSLQKGNNLTQYIYDAQNRLQSVMVNGSKAASYAYDADGKRTQKIVYRRDLALYNDNVNATLFGSVTNPLPATSQNLTIDTTIYVDNLYETESGASRQTKFIYLGHIRVAAVDGVNPT